MPSAPSLPALFDSGLAKAEAYRQLQLIPAVLYQISFGFFAAQGRFWELGLLHV